MNATKTTYTLKASINFLGGEEDSIAYRSITVVSGISLHKLAETILESFEFNFDHAYGFYDNIKKWSNSKEGYELFADTGEESRFKGVKKTKIEDVFNSEKKKMLFLFDYGDQWHFIVELLSTGSPEKNDKYPKIIESVGDAPPQYESFDREYSDDFDGDFDEFEEYFEDDKEVAETERRLRKIFEIQDDEEIPTVSDQTLKTYYDYLKKGLSLPASAMHYDEEKDKEFKVAINKLIEYTDESEEALGILCECVKGKAKVVLPLAEIETSEKDRNFQLIDDYCFWYWECY